MLSKQLEDTGSIPRVRGAVVPKPSWRGLIRVAIIVVVVVGVVATVVWFTTRPSTTVQPDDGSAGTVPALGREPQQKWKVSATELFPGLGGIASAKIHQPGRFRSEMDSIVLVSASNAANRGQLIALNLADGSVKWRVSASTRIECADRPVNNMVACLYDAQLRLLTWDTGEVVRMLPANVTARQVAVAANTVVALSGRSTGEGRSSIVVQAFDGDGKTLWTDQRTVLGSSFSLAVAQSLVAVNGVTTTDGKPVVYTLATGGMVDLPTGVASLSPNGEIAVTAEGSTRLCSDTGACSDTQIEGSPIPVSVYDSQRDDMAVFTLSGEAGAQQLHAASRTGGVLWSRPVVGTPTLGLCRGELLVRDEAQVAVVSQSSGDSSRSLGTGKTGTGLWCGGDAALVFTESQKLAAFGIESGQVNDEFELAGLPQPSLTATTAGFLQTGTTWSLWG